VGDVIAKVDESGEGTGSTDTTPEPEAKEETKETVAEEAPAATETTEEAPEVVATPAARKRARELDIDLSEVLPRDPLGRIRPEDVEVAKANQTKEAAKPAPAETTPAPSADAKPVECVRMSRR